ncbi:hypothetical protein E2C01_061623 [Portunus trituberculatus]|uniref:Uncharacterized protein n=1 Tax=Portunus trituberculatus TaxID=210409 RepID=A0A5B7HDQ6_PORTR|nr:hypothetical protein [Portunus trituberculatus]
MALKGLISLPHNTKQTTSILRLLACRLMEHPRSNASVPSVSLNQPVRAGIGGTIAAYCTLLLFTPSQLPGAVCYLCLNV